jgi:uncharacterized UBP type Zn finger protein
MQMKPCPHLKEAKDLPVTRHVCDDCIKNGDKWVHLRLCLTCGHMGCCDSSKNTHASRHFREAKHPMIRSAEPGETWGWCYVDETLYDLSDGIVKARVQR